MNRRGVTLIEMMFVFVIISVMVAFAFPRIGAGLDRQAVSSARAMFSAMHARARGIAIQRGSQTQLVVSNGQLTIRSLNPVSGANEQVGNVQDLVKRYGVAVSPSSFTLTFDPRGIGMETSQTTVSITKGASGASVLVSAVGRIQ